MPGAGWSNVVSVMHLADGHQLQRVILHGRADGAENKHTLRKEPTFGPSRRRRTIQPLDEIATLE